MRPVRWGAIYKRACLAGSLRAVGLLIEGGEFARRRVFPHLAVPLVTGPAAEFSGDLRPLFHREPLDRRPDFLNRAHTQSQCPEVAALATKMALIPSASIPTP
jgi:hypothetical protein